RLFGLRGEGECDRKGIQQPRAFSRNSHVHKIILNQRGLVLLYAAA
ncbi:hypothetical protein HMPREF1619_01047, partial [Klebsiella pneumoniae 909957]